MMPWYTELTRRGRPESRCSWSPSIPRSPQSTHSPVPPSACPDEPDEGHADPRALAFQSRMQGGTINSLGRLFLRHGQKQNYFLFYISNVRKIILN